MIYRKTTKLINNVLISLSVDFQGSTMYQKANVGMFGLGTVGSGVVKYLKEFYDPEKTGVELNLSKICVRSLDKPRSVRIDKSLLTTNPKDILDNPSIDVVVEVIGGIHPAGEYIERALKNGKHIVTANKALLTHSAVDNNSSHAKDPESRVLSGVSLGGYSAFACAMAEKVNLGFEASVCGEIPIIDVVSNLPSNNYVIGLEGILNGTSNYILTKMSRGQSYDNALKNAQVKGFAESDPSFDVDGKDASQKLAILSTLIFGRRVELSQVNCESITPISEQDIMYAEDMSYVIKPLSLARKHKDYLELRVCPTLLPKTDILSSVNFEMNAVSLYFKDRKEPMTLYGAGAGMMPTASSIIKDIVAVLKDSPESRASVYTLFTSFNNFANQSCEFNSPYYLRVNVADQPRVLSSITNILGQHDINIEELKQVKRLKRGGTIPVAMLLSPTTEDSMNSAVEQIKSLNQGLKVKDFLVKEVLKMRRKDSSYMAHY